MDFFRFRDSSETKKHSIFVLKIRCSVLTFLHVGSKLASVFFNASQCRSMVNGFKS